MEASQNGRIVSLHEDAIGTFLIEPEADSSSGNLDAAGKVTGCLRGRWYSTHRGRERHGRTTEATHPQRVSRRDTREVRR
jgi:hypothetical protein